MWVQRVRELLEWLGFPRKCHEAESLNVRFEDPNVHPEAISTASFTLPDEAAKAFKSQGTYPLPLGEIVWENPWTISGNGVIGGELMGIRGRTAVIREKGKPDPALTYFRLVDMRGLATGCEAEIKSQWHAYRRGNVEFYPPDQDARGTASFFPIRSVYGNLPADLDAVEKRAAASNEGS